MTDTRVEVLTPPGAGAIATVAVTGPDAWEIVRRLFRPAGASSLPLAPPLHRFWFGHFGEGIGDEVVLAVREVSPETRVELHCHGGRHVVRWVVGQLAGQGCVRSTEGVQELGKPRDGRPWASGAQSAMELLPRAPTLRTASILLDQYHGAFDRAMSSVQTFMKAGDTSSARQILQNLCTRIPVGMHLVEPWKVVVAGPPNVGKSSLVNALAGYQRSVVSDAAGTTRDIVTTSVAFEGWPVELADTAGLRRAVDSSEAEGIERARRFLAGADLVIWVIDATAAEPVGPSEEWLREGGLRDRVILRVTNKVDAAEQVRDDSSLRVSARTGRGIPELIRAVVQLLVGEGPPPGAAVPFSAELAEQCQNLLCLLASVGA